MPFYDSYEIASAFIDGRVVRVYYLDMTNAEQSRLASRTAQELLQERRQNVLESMRAADSDESALLLWHVDTIDAELQSRRVAR